MEYQNIFTQIQVQGPLETGVKLPAGNDERIGKPFTTSLPAGSAMPRSVRSISAFSALPR
ncbi:MAG: hypothetical protein R3D29_08750 [Nitratireductor sp.]